ncbi:two-component response regulator [Salmonella enterica subsp. enterica]|uniref:Two-component response regulator n=1 Tax=Salmonella enterica I TaxID=59201 RepID=A0A379X352_SALET|nr:two-component response regulator [Salmonella enterica subsp. enterica]
MINVLIVDDDAMVAELNRRYVAQISGFHCCGTASTLEKAKSLSSTVKITLTNPAGYLYAAGKRIGSAACPAQRRLQKRRYCHFFCR